MFRIQTKKESRKVLTLRDLSGERGIRTPGTSQYNGFQDRRDRPLCHLSKTSFREVLPFKSDAKVRLIFESASVRGIFLRKKFQPTEKTTNNAYIRKIISTFAPY